MTGKRSESIFVQTLLPRFMILYKIIISLLQFIWLYCALCLQYIIFCICVTVLGLLCTAKLLFLRHAIVFTIFWSCHFEIKRKRLNENSDIQSTWKIEFTQIEQISLMQKWICFNVRKPYKWFNVRNPCKYCSPSTI